MKAPNAIWIGAAVVALTAWAGCAEEPPTGIDLQDPPPPGTVPGTEPAVVDGAAEAFFIDNVYPDLEAMCGSCHITDSGVGAPEWMEMGAEAAYATVKAYPDMVNAPDCAKITIYPKSSDHAGPPPDGPLEATLVQWLSMEALENGLACAGAPEAGEPGPLEACNTALADFQSCMSYAYWQTSDMDEVPLQNSAQGQCVTCHNNGNSGVFLDSDEVATFNAHMSDQFFLVKLVRCVISDGEFVGLQAANRYLNKGTEACSAVNGNCHPAFTMTQLRQNALEEFVANTAEAAVAGTCVQLDEQAQIELDQEIQ
jgi:hypothetical protein